MAFSGSGAGTSGDPYIITTLTELNEIRDDLTAYYELANDIDASDTSTWNGGAGWVPIDDFEGNFDGKDYTIDSLYIDRSGTNYVGFFGRGANATSQPIIDNLHFTNIDITAADFSCGLYPVGVKGVAASGCSIEGTLVLNGNNGGGGMFAELSGDTSIAISNCWVNATMTVSGGGLFGGFAGKIQNENGDLTAVHAVEECYTTGALTHSSGAGSGVLGGFYGGAESATGGADYETKDSYSTMNVSGGSNAAGFAGRANSDVALFTRCWSAGLVENATTEGGFSSRDGDAVDTNCFWDTETSGQATSADGTGKTTAEMQQQSTFTNYNFTSIWSMGDEEYLNYPVLQWQVSRYTYVFDLSNPNPGQAWTQFEGLDITEAIILSRGEVDENLNLFLTSGQTVEQYPGSSYTGGDAHIMTKDFPYDLAILKKFRPQFEGSSTEVLTIVESQYSSNPDNKKYKTFTSLTSDKWQGVDPTYARGERITFKIADVDIIKSLLFRVKVKGV